MVVRRRKLSRRKRGSRTHGWGEGKKHRGAGSRGGRGRAGTGKRGAQKLTKYLSKKQKTIGKVGFRQRKPKTKKLNPINLRDIEQKLDKWLANKQITKKGDVFVVDLKKLGYTKVLSQGKITKKIKLICNKASKAAKEKVKAAGGEITNK
ncbi:50S ribosomal protein L15 [Candidatus Woesearchaeota archaeon]|nr:50S ribosomal protein L15 [Candidatus Woesearchaeota archaeon]